VHKYEPERLFVIFTAYFDESGTHGGSPITVMGGVMANVAQWDRFEADFRRLKRRHGFSVFHTKKFKNRTGEFKGWSVPQAHALVADMKVISAHAFTEGAVMTLDNAAYQKEYLAGEKPRTLRLDSKYGLCFRRCLIHFLTIADKRRHKSKPTKINAILEAGHPNHGDAERIFFELKKEFKGTRFDLLDTYGLAEKDECDPLMVADFIAHSSYAVEIKKRDGKVQGQSTRRQERPPQGVGTAITHMSYRPGGLAEFKAKLVEKVNRRRGASSGQSS
jgi:hypothetical protein